MPTAQDLISNALMALGELAPRQSPNASESAQGLITLNNIVGSWNIQDSMATASTTATVSLTSGTQSYALSTRVTRIVSASVLMAAGPTMPVRILSADEWNQIEDKDASSNLVQGLFYDRGFPTGTVYLAPRPLASETLSYLAWAAQSTFAALSTNNTLLPGYERALTAALAIEMAGFYPARRVPPTLAAMFADSMTEIKRLNASLWSMTPAATAVQPDKAAAA